MKRVYVIFFPVLLMNVCSLAQNMELITVKAGKTLVDYIPVTERYQYPEFTTGKVFFITNIY
jgi:hypothetical protein